MNLSIACWLCGAPIPLAHPSLRQIAPCPTCIEKLRAVVKDPPPPSPASAGWTREHKRLAEELFGLSWWADIECFGEESVNATLAAIARVAPHFAPKVRVRVPSGYLVSSPLAQTHGVALGCAEADRQWIAALRQAGVEIEGEQDGA